MRSAPISSAEEAPGEGGAVGWSKTRVAGSRSPVGAEPVTQLDGGQRVDAEVSERTVGRDRVGVGVSEYRAHLGTDQVEQSGPASGGGLPEQGVPQLRVPIRGAGRGGGVGNGAAQGSGRLPDQAAQHGVGGGVAGRQGSEVEAGGEDGALG